MTERDTSPSEEVRATAQYGNVRPTSRPTRRCERRQVSRGGQFLSRGQCRRTTL